MTPEKMRALADERWDAASFIVEAKLALRAAADQLEAVREHLHDILDHHEGNSDETYQSLYAWYTRLTADTAPQEDRPAVDWDRFDREVLGDD